MVAPGTADGEKEAGEKGGNAEQRERRATAAGVTLHKAHSPACQPAGIAPPPRRTVSPCSWVWPGKQHAIKRSEIELIDVLFIEYLWRPKKDLTPVDDLYLSKFSRLKLGRARF